MEKQLSNYKQNQTSLSDSKTQNQSKVVDKMKEKFENQISELEKTLSNQQNQLQEQSISIRMNETMADRILLSAKRIYNTEFPSLSDLSSFMDTLDSNYLNPQFPPNKQDHINEIIQNSPEKSPKNKSLCDEIAIENAVDIVKQKLKKQKEKTKIVIAENRRLNTLLEKKENMLKDYVNSNNQNNRSLQQDLINKSEEFELKEANYKSTIASLTQRNEQLKDQISKMKKEMVVPSDIVQKIDPPPKPTKESQPTFQKNPDALHVMQEQYLVRINDLEEQLSIHRKKRDEMFEQMRKSVATINELRISSEKNEKSREETEKLYQETMIELKQAKEDLQEFDSIVQKNETYKQNLKEMRQLIINMNKQIKEQDAQNKDNEVLLKQKDNTITKSEQEIKHLNGEIEKQYDEIGHLKAQIAALHDEIGFLKEPKEYDIPSSVFSSLPKDLYAKAISINDNKMMQTGTKIQNFIKVITTYYTKIIDDNEKKQTSTTKQLNETIQKLMSFITNCSISTLEEPVASVDSFLNPETNTSQKILDFIADIKKQLGETILYAESLENELNRFNNTLGLSGEDTPEMLEDLKTSFAKKNEIISRKSQKNKELKRQIEKLEIDLEQEKKSNEDTVQQLKKEIESNEQLIKQLRKEKQELTLKLNDLQTNYNELDDELNETKNLMQNDNELLKQQYEEQKQKLEAAFADHVNNLKKEIESRNCRLSKQNETEQNYKNLILKQSNEIKDLEDSKAKLEQEMKDKQTKLEKKNEEDKKNLKQVYEAAIEKLKKQCEDLRNDTYDLSSELSEKNQLNIKLQKKLDKTIAKLQTTERKNASLEEQNHRDKLLMESANKAQIVFQDAQVSEKISKIKEQYEKENRNMYLYIIDIFKQFFTPKDSIDYSSIRRVLKTASSELNRLSKAEKSIKALLNATEYQTLEDAVSQLYYEAHND